MEFACQFHRLIINWESVSLFPVPSVRKAMSGFLQTALLTRCRTFWSAESAAFIPIHEKNFSLSEPPFPFLLAYRAVAKIT